MASITVYLPSAGTMPGIPGFFAPGFYTVDYTARTATFISSFSPNIQAYPLTRSATTLFVVAANASNNSRTSADFLCNGTNDDQVITAAINVLSGAGGGEIVLSEGTFNTSSAITLISNIHIRGMGIGATTVRLSNGANCDIFSAQTGSINLSASFGTGVAGTLYNFTLSNMTLDGNKANQTAGPSYPLRFYGYGFILMNLRIKNGYSGGSLIDWNGGSSSPGNDSMEAQIINVKVHDSGGIGFQFGGPHDSHIVNLISYSHTYHCLHIAPNAPGTQLTSCHYWAPGLGVVAAAALVEAGSVFFENCQAEGSDNAQVALISSGNHYIGGHVFGSGSGQSTAYGVQFGQAAGQAPYYGMINQSAGLTTAVVVKNNRVDTLISNCTFGALRLANDGGNNSIHAVINQTSGNAVAGSSSPSSDISTVITGITSTGNLATGGTKQFSGQASSLFHITDTVNDVVNVNTFASPRRFELVNGASLEMYTDLYTTISLLLVGDANGTIKFANDSNATLARTVAGVINIGGTYSLNTSNVATISTGNTLAIGNVGVRRVTMTANVTGIIMPVGSVAGQIVIVENTSAFSMTFDVVGTSHVADGANVTIAANRYKMLIWDGSNWYAD